VKWIGFQNGKSPATRSDHLLQSGLEEEVCVRVGGGRIACYWYLKRELSMCCKTCTYRLQCSQERNRLRYSREWNRCNDSQVLEWTERTVAISSLVTDSFAPVHRTLRSYLCTSKKLHPAPSRLRISTRSRFDEALSSLWQQTREQLCWDSTWSR
jgi:hypothetical protein